MLNPIHLLRAKRWLHNPPSVKQIKLFVALCAIAAVVVGLEHFGFWPEWATTERMPRRTIGF